MPQRKLWAQCSRCRAGAHSGAHAGGFDEFGRGIHAHACVPVSHPCAGVRAHLDGYMRFVTLLCSSAPFAAPAHAFAPGLMLAQCLHHCLHQVGAHLTSARAPLFEMQVPAPAVRRPLGLCRPHHTCGREARAVCPYGRAPSPRPPAPGPGACALGGAVRWLRVQVCALTRVRPAHALSRRRALMLCTGAAARECASLLHLRRQANSCHGTQTPAGQPMSRHADTGALPPACAFGQVSWAQQFLPAAAEARAARARACLLWKRQLLGKALQGWKAEAAR